MSSPEGLVARRSLIFSVDVVMANQLVRKNLDETAPLSILYQRRYISMQIRKLLCPRGLLSIEPDVHAAI